MKLGMLVDIDYSYKLLTIRHQNP